MTEKESLYAELFEKYHISLQNFCMAKGVGRENADDIVSEAFARALEHADLFLTLEPEKQRTWLYSAAKLVMKEQWTRLSPIPFSEIEGMENIPEVNDSLQRYQEEEAYRESVRQVYAELSEEKDRELFRLIYDRKIDYDTLTKKYGITTSSVRSMVSRFRGKLRKIVNKVLNS